MADTDHYSQEILVHDMVPFKLHEIRNAMPKAPMLSVYVLWLSINGLIAFFLLGAVAGILYLAGFVALWIVQVCAMVCLSFTIAIMVAVRINRYLADRSRLE